MNTLVSSTPTTFLTLREVAEFLRLSELTVYRLVERRLLPCYRFSRRLRFRRADLDGYVAARRDDGAGDEHPHGSA